jgi:hypothetical protein
LCREHKIELADIGPVARAADRAYDLRGL